MIFGTKHYTNQWFHEIKEIPQSILEQHKEASK
jgi:hypothetical protein